MENAGARLRAAEIVAAQTETLAHLFYFARCGNVHSPSDPRHTMQNCTPDGPEVELAGIAQGRILQPYLGHADAPAASKVASVEVSRVRSDLEPFGPSPTQLEMILLTDRCQIRPAGAPNP